jgi:hypothetical protein
LKQSRGLYHRFNLIIQEESVRGEKVLVLTLRFLQILSFARRRSSQLHRPKFVVMNRSSFSLALGFPVEDKIVAETIIAARSNSDITSFRLRTANEFITGAVFSFVPDQNGSVSQIVRGNDLPKASCSSSWDLSTADQRLLLSLPIRRGSALMSEGYQIENRVLSLTVLEFESIYYSIVFGT